MDHEGAGDGAIRNALAADGNRAGCFHFGRLEQRLGRFRLLFRLRGRSFRL
jgi:hypothetical protein